MARELSRSIAQTRRAFRSCTDREIVINYSGGVQGRPLILSRGSFTPIFRYQTTITSRLTLSFVRHKRFINHVNGERGQFTLQATDLCIILLEKSFDRSLKRFIPLFFFFLHLTCTDMQTSAFFNRSSNFFYMLLVFRLSEISEKILLRWKMKYAGLSNLYSKRNFYFFFFSFFIFKIEMNIVGNVILLHLKQCSLRIPSFFFLAMHP